MSLWIKRDVLLPRNRKTYRLAELLAQGSGDLFGGRDEVAWQALAIVLLEEFWAHVAEHYPSGDITDAPELELRSALRPWLEGTSWARQDVRMLLEKSGHVTRTRRGRTVVRDWREWTGSDMERLAKDRKRKRLARARRPPRVRRRSTGQAEEKTTLAERSRAELREEKKQPAAATPALDYATRCVIAVNRALEAKLGAFKSLVATVEQEVAQTWEALGVPIELAEQVLADVTRRFRSTSLNRQPSTLRYFDAAIREAFEADRAHGAGRPEVPYDEAVRLFREAGLETYHVPGPGFKTRQALERALASARRSAVA